MSWLRSLRALVTPSAVAWTLVSTACPAEEGANLTGRPPENPGVSSTGDETSSSSGGAQDEICGECWQAENGKGFCAAEVPAHRGPADDAGNYLCLEVCVPTESSAYWCANDASCCDPEAVCCRPPPAGTTETGNTESGETETEGAGGGPCQPAYYGYCIVPGSDSDTGETSSGSSTASGASTESTGSTETGSEGTDSGPQDVDASTTARARSQHDPGGHHH